MSRSDDAPRSARTHSLPWRASRSRAVNLPPPDVARIIRDSSTWPSWQPEILATRGSRELDPGDAVVGDAQMLGFKIAGRADIVSVEEGAIAQDVIVGIRMRVTYELDARGATTLVTHRIDADLPRGLSGRLLSFFLRYRLRAMQRRLLDDLAGMTTGG